MKNITNVRKSVVTLANRLNKKLKDLSASFRTAWQMIKAQQFIVSKVAGVTQGKIQKALTRLAGYNPQSVSVDLVREPENPFDGNAIGVNVSVNGSAGYRIGYLPREVVIMVSTLIDNGIKLTVAFKRVTGGEYGKPTLGALIEIVI